MSLTSKQIDELRAYAKERKGELAKLINDAADTIELLSTKLSAANMERSSQYYHGGWIPCSERLPEDIARAVSGRKAGRMKDKTMMMYDHICSSADVDLWAITELKKVLDAYLADGCSGCAYASVVEWELPCRKCKRNSKDYWRRAERREEP